MTRFDPTAEANARYYESCGYVKTADDKDTGYQAWRHPNGSFFWQCGQNFGSGTVSYGGYANPSGLCESKPSLDG